VLDLVVAGLLKKQIADRLGTSERRIIDIHIAERFYRAWHIQVVGPEVSQPYSNGVHQAVRRRACLERKNRLTRRIEIVYLFVAHWSLDRPGSRIPTFGASSFCRVTGVMLLLESPKKRMNR
jgi:hypothetical protein